MTVKMFRRLVVVFALASVLVACDGSPIAPTPQACQDPAATNFGGPLPCTYLPPAESYVRVVRTVPNKDGAILNPKKEEVYAWVEYGVSQADIDEAVRSGDTIITTTCPSIDGTTPIPICFGRLAPGSRGENEHHFGVNLEFNPEAMQTKYIISYLKRIHNSGQGQTEWEIATSVFPLIVNWRVP